jgi:hypothetical protein
LCSFRLMIKQQYTIKYIFSFLVMATIFNGGRDYQTYEPVIKNQLNYLRNYCINVRKPNGQTIMNNPETQVTMGTRHRTKKTKQKNKKTSNTDHMCLTGKLIIKTWLFIPLMAKSLFQLHFGFGKRAFENKWCSSHVLLDSRHILRINEKIYRSSE